MSYKDHPITSVRFSTYDKLWHVYYLVKSLHTNKMRETYDRVTEKEALSVTKKIVKRDPKLTYAI